MLVLRRKRRGRREECNGVDSYDYYRRLRSYYLSRGLTLSDLYSCVEEGFCDKVRERLGNEYDYVKVFYDLFDWMDLAEKYNPDELRFLSDP